MNALNGVRYSRQAMDNVHNLLSYCIDLGLSFKDLSLRSGISLNAINNYRRGKVMPSVKSYNSLADVLGWRHISTLDCKVPKQKQAGKKRAKYKVSKNYEAISIDYSDAPKIPLPIAFSFAEEHCYRIFTTGNIKSIPQRNLTWEQSCIFRYVKKEGIHHMFREIRGGWSRTYTDAQLIGKTIMEVQPAIIEKQPAGSKNLGIRKFVREHLWQIKAVRDKGYSWGQIARAVSSRLNIPSRNLSSSLSSSYSKEKRKEKKYD